MRPEGVGGYRGVSMREGSGGEWNHSVCCTCVQSSKELRERKKRISFKRLWPKKETLLQIEVQADRGQGAAALIYQALSDSLINLL